MTPKQKGLVRRSWAQLEDKREETSALFYQNLFDINPNSRRLFGRRDMHLQGSLFVEMVSEFVRSLDGSEPGITDVIQASGRRHAGYGVMNSDYEGVGEALIGALGDMLGPRFTPDVRDAWKEAYRALSAAMQQSSSSIL